MIRTAVTIGLFFISTSASGQQTQCRWVGNVWTCDQSPEPLDYGKIMKAGQDLVAPYESPKRVERIYAQPAPVAEVEYIDGELAIEQCELDSVAIASGDPNHPRKKQRAFFGGYLPKNQRPQFAQICSAYMLGKIAGAKQK